MDLSTTYLGLELPHPFISGASPLTHDLDQVKRLQDAGAAAITMHSLFEEQIRQEELVAFRDTELPAESFAEALSYFPRTGSYALGPDRYLEQIQRIKEATGLPVIASLNGITTTGWLDYGKRIQEAGADALEVNVYYVATDPQVDAAQVEGRILDIVRTLSGSVQIPIAVKLSPYFSALSSFAVQLQEAGAGGLVLFNRFYQPDIDIEQLEAAPRLRLSDSSELLLRLRWLAILHGKVTLSLGASGGVHEPTDAIKALMAGASAVQMVSALLSRGVDQLRTVREAVSTWLEEHRYDSLGQLQGSMSQARCPDPAAFERGNYMKILTSWRPGRDQL